MSTELPPLPDIHDLSPAAIKARRAVWTAALRSGEYVQGKGALECDGKYCCLGVACQVIPGVRGRSSGDLLTGASARLLGLGVRGPGPTQYELSEPNDCGVPFPEIADKIDAMPTPDFTSVTSTTDPK